MACPLPGKSLARPQRPLLAASPSLPAYPVTTHRLAPTQSPGALSATQAPLVLSGLAPPGLDLSPFAIAHPAGWHSNRNTADLWKEN